MKKLFSSICALVLTFALIAGTMIFADAATGASATDAPGAPETLSADFSNLTQGAVREDDTATVNYLQDRFAFYYFQHMPDWKLSDPLMYFFERPNVNGYIVDDGSYCRLPDTAGVIHAQLDGVPDKEGKYEFPIKPAGYWANIPTWTIDGEWIYCTAYSGENATLFRQENLMYLRGNTDSTLANIKNFDLQMDFMFKAVDGETIVDGKDNLAIIFDAATAGNVTYENQLMFAVAPDGQYFLGKPQTWYAPAYNGQFTDSAENNVTLEREKKYHLSMRHIGNIVYIVITDEAGNQVINHTAQVPNVLSGVGGNLAITGSNAGAKYANITVTRLDDNATAYDYSNNANGYQFGVTARQFVNWVNPYWSDWSMEYNAIYLRNSSSVFWSNKWPDDYAGRTYIPVDGDYDKFAFGSAQSLKNISNELGTMFTVYHDAINGGTNYFAKAPNFDSHHAESGIDGSKYGQMYLSAHGAKSVALLAYLDGSKYPDSALLDQTMSLAPKTSDGRNIQTKNFRTQFNTYLPESTKSAISLSFRSQAAGAMIGTDKCGYANKVTLLLTASGWYLDTGDGEVALMGSPSVWNSWDTAGSYVGDVSVYAEAVGTTLKIKVTATTGAVLLDTTETIPEGNSGYIYYSAVNTMGNFYSINCDRLDDNGNVSDWNTASADYTIGDINGDGEVNIVDLVCIKKYAANLKTYNFDAANLFEDKYIDASDVTVLRQYLLGTVQI